VATSIWLQGEALNRHLLSTSNWTSDTTLAVVPVAAGEDSLASSLMGNFQVLPILVQCQQTFVEIRQIHFSNSEYE